jgi:very-short-patch-repair endonuclease
MTDAEQKLWWHLRRMPIETSLFRRQATIGPYFADFACHSCRLVIEVDGSGRAVDGQIISDAKRTEFLNSRGYRVLRFWNNEVLNDIAAVMVVIHDAVNESVKSPPTPSPSPPLRGGRGKAESGS